MKSAIALIAGLLLAAPAGADMFPNASNAQNPAARSNIMPGAVTGIYYARDYGSCAWTTDDVGVCINAAIAAAATAGGGTVIVPDGDYVLGTTLLGRDAVRLQGAGWRKAGDNCGTKLIASSALAGGTMVRVGDDAVAALTMGAGISDICLDGAGQAAKGLQLLSSQNGVFERLSIRGATSRQLELGVAALDPGGTARNDFSNIFLGATEAAAISADGLYITDGTALNDVHHNNFYNIDIVVQNGSGFRCGGADSNKFFGFRAYAEAAGRSALFKAGPNAGDLIGWCRYNTFFGATFGGDGVGALVAEGTETGPNASSNTIYGFKKGGMEPSPTVGTDAKIFGFDTLGTQIVGGAPWIFFKGNPPVTNKNATPYNLTLNDSGTTFNNRSGSGNQVFNLPVADATTGTWYVFCKWTAGSQITITAQGADIIRTTAGDTPAAGSVYATQQFACGHIAAQFTGTWIFTPLGEPSRWAILNDAPIGSKPRLQSFAGGTFALTAFMSGIHFNNANTGGALTQLTLPAAAAGLNYCVAVTVAATVRFTAQAGDVIYDGSTVSASGGKIEASTKIAKVCLEAHGTGQWFVISKSGTWTVT